MFSSSSPGIASLLLLCLLCCQLGITAVPPLGGLRGQWAWWKPSLESLFLHTSGAAFWDVVAGTWLHVHPWACVHPFVCVCVVVCHPASADHCSRFWVLGSGAPSQEHCLGHGEWASPRHIPGEHSASCPSGAAGGCRQAVRGFIPPVCFQKPPPTEGTGDEQLSNVLIDAPSKSVFLCNKVGSAICF